MSIATRNHRAQPQACASNTVVQNDAHHAANVEVVAPLPSLTVAATCGLAAPHGVGVIDAAPALRSDAVTSADGDDAILDVAEGLMATAGDEISLEDSNTDG